METGRWGGGGGGGGGGLSSHAVCMSGKAELARAERGGMTAALLELFDGGAARALYVIHKNVCLSL